MNKGLKIKLLLLFTALLVLLSGCTIDDPGYVILDSDSKVQVVDSDGDVITIDEMTTALTTIDYPHHELHEGSSFFTDFVNDTLGNNDTIIVAFKVPAGTKRAHIVVEFSTLVGGNLQIWESPTWTTNTGVLNPILNRKRLAVMPSSIVLEDLTATPAFTATDNVLVNVTGLNTAGATSLHHFYAWGIRGKISGGSARDIEELILKPDTQYAIVFTSSGANNSAQVILNWYEHQDN